MNFKSPKISMNSSKTAPKIILMLLSHLTPRFKPVIAEPKKIQTMSTVIAIFVTLLFGTWKT